ncbi:hypothetical protein KBC40_02235 [Patescibacteria group bacterium]|nr:hypothetical protein [Patescibacteria group bacterium]
MLPFSDICQAIVIPMSSSASAFVWQIVLFLWPWNWIWITCIILIWVVFEILTRNGEIHYNSKNGFSPAFNIFIGSGVFAIFQAITFLIFQLFFGGIVYCLPWPYALHLIIFASTSLFLHKIRFWPEIRIFKRRKKYFRRSFTKNKK